VTTGSQEGTQSRAPPFVPTSVSIPSAGREMVTVVPSRECIVNVVPPFILLLLGLCVVSLTKAKRRL